jgi:hypothetical protein
MADVTDLEEKLRALVPKVATDKERLSMAVAEKAAAEAELLRRVVELVKPALPAICTDLRPNSKLRNLELVPGKPQTALEDGVLDEEPELIVRNGNVKSILERLEQLLEAQKRDRVAEKAERTAAKVRLILAMLRDPL